MGEESFDDGVRRLLGGWNRSIIDKNAEATAALREDGYTATLPGGAVLTQTAFLLSRKS